MHAKWLCLPGTICSNNPWNIFKGIDSSDLCVEVIVTLVNLVVSMKQHDGTVSVTTFEGLAVTILILMHNNTLWPSPPTPFCPPPLDHYIHVTWYVRISYGIQVVWHCIHCTVSIAGVDLSTVTVPLGSMMYGTHTTSVALPCPSITIITMS